MAKKQPPFDIQALSFLLIDNDENMRRMVLDVLRSFGVSNSREATNGDEAIRILETFMPDVVVCEWELPVLNGIEFTRQLRRDVKSPHRMVAVIFVTAHTQLWQVTEARDAGINEFLAKPISARSLYARICAVIERPRPFIEADNFVGPDRRRRHDPYKVALARREVDRAAEALAPGGEISDDDIDAMLGL